jgi:small conductance mechanosensitive channel
MQFDHIEFETLQDWFDPATSSGAVLLGIVFFIAAIVLSMLITRLMHRSAWVMGHLGRKVDKTAVNYLIRFKTLIVFLGVALIYASLVPSLRSLLGTLLAGAGITALVFGMAAKSTLANLMSGLALIVYRPVRIGDIVEIDNKYGYIEDITLRHTIMRTWKHERLIIPNEKMDSMTLINYSLIDPRVISTVEVGVSYDTDLDLSKSLMLDEAAKCPYLLPDADPPWVRMVDFADSSLILRAYMWTRSKDDAFQAKFWFVEHIKNRFDAEGIEIPFPYRTLVEKKDLPEARRPEHKFEEAEFTVQSPPPMVVEQPRTPPPGNITRKLRRLKKIFRNNK